MKGLAIFGWMSLGIIGLLIFIFVIFFVFFAKSQTGNPLDIPDKVQALASMLALFFGTAAAVGGAIATLQVASLGLDISERQESRDSTQFIDDKSAKTISLYSSLLVSLSDVLASATVVDVKIPHLEKEGVIGQMNDTAPDALKTEMLALSERLLNLNAAITEILKDDFSHYCFQESISSINSKLVHINKTLGILGVPDSELTLSIEHLSDINAIIELAARRIDDGGLGDLIQSRVFTNSSDIEMFNLHYDSRNVRTFVFTGNLIFARSDIDTQTKNMYIASYGAAILHDLQISVPNGDLISECLASRYPSIAKQAKEHQLHFNPNNVTSKNFLSAIRDIETIGDLYLLIGDAS